jgi:hypothetical protein
MVYIKVALVDPDIAAKPHYHRVDLNISDDETIVAVYNGLCGSAFVNLIGSNSRGLNFVVFTGTDKVTHRVDDLIVNDCGVQKWNDVCGEFLAIGLVSFTIFQRPRIVIEINREQQLMPLHGMFLSRSQQIESTQLKEIKERGDLLPDIMPKLRL